MSTPPVPSFTLSAAPAAFSISRGYNNRTEPARTHPLQLVTVHVAPVGALRWVEIWVDDTSQSPGSPGLRIGGQPGYVDYYGGQGAGPPSWSLTIRFQTMPKSVPVGLHRCVVKGRINERSPWVSIPLTITVVDP